MRRHPTVPGVEEALPEFADGGHLWVQELVAGDPFRFQLQRSGALRVGTRTREFDADDAPLRYRHAIRYLRESLDASALRAAVDDVESVVCFGVATTYDGIDYDWARTPSIVGVVVWDDARGAFLAVDATERVFERVGLDLVHVAAREVHVRDYDFEDPEMPTSAYYDGPAAGVVVRKKTGERLGIPNPVVDRTMPRDPPVPVDETGALDAIAVAEHAASRERFERVARDVRERGLPVSFVAIYDRVLDSIYREAHDWLLAGDDAGVGFDLGEFRNEVAERTSEFVADAET